MQLLQASKNSLSLLECWTTANNGIIDNQYAATTSYFLISGSGRMIGATSRRHYLTVEGYQSWGHIGYGIRPSERGKGFAVKALRLMLKEAKNKK